MPSILRDPNTNNTRAQDKLSSVSYDYDYPDGLDLRPSSALHRKIISEVMDRARESYNVMQARHNDWRKIDRTLTSYVPLDQTEKDIKDDDDRKPVSVVVPISYSILDTILSYWMSAFLEDPIFRYIGVGPEDAIGAAMLEHVIDAHCKRLKVGLQLYVMWRDSIAYGIGPVAPIWERKDGFKTVTEDVGFFGNLIKQFIKTGTARKTVETIIYEGNKLLNIDPYKYLPDPNVPIHDVQAGEFVGWSDGTSYTALLREEQFDDTMFNVRYVKHIDGRGTLYGKDNSYRSERYGISTNPVSTRPVDMLYMYIDIIPSEWGLGDSNYPEKWFFSIAGEQVVVSAKPLGLNHNMFPVAISAPTFDGYSVTPVSMLEVIYGLQEAADWEFSSHVANVRKIINNTLVVDPSLVNIHDIKSAKAGGIYRLRRAAWGRGVNDAVHQLAVNDVTRGNVADAGTLMDMANRTLASSDSMQGVMRHTSERKSATEARNAQVGSISRLEKGARISSMQAMYDIAYMFASHTQQLMSEDTYIKIAGRYEDDLIAEYGEAARLHVRPSDLEIAFDIEARDGSVPSGEYADSWIQLYGMAAGNPEIAGTVDFVKVFKHIARIMGAKNVEDFMKRGVDKQVQPQEVIDQQVQQGNYVPTGV